MQHCHGRQYCAATGQPHAGPYGLHQLMWAHAWSLQAVRRRVGTVEGSAACRPATKSAARRFRDGLERALRLGRGGWTCTQDTL